MITGWMLHKLLLQSIQTAAFFSPFRKYNYQNRKTFRQFIFPFLGKLNDKNQFDMKRKMLFGHFGSNVRVR